MSTDTQVVRAKLMDDFKAVMYDADELLKATANQTGERIASIRLRVEESLREARRKLDEMETNLVMRTKTTIKATDQLVHDNPWRSVVLATALGFICGMVIRRR